MLKKLFPVLFLGTLAAMFYANHPGYAQIPHGQALIAEIQKGGYILYIRHGEATVGRDAPGLTFSDCNTQRNLSEIGRNQAKAIGMLLRKKSVPIRYPVIASPFCRTRESAELAFGKQNVLVNPVLASIIKLDELGVSSEQKQQILDSLTKMLEIPPVKGTNMVIIAHSFPRNIALGEIPSMGTVLIRPKGIGNGYEVLGKLTIDQFR